MARCNRAFNEAAIIGSRKGYRRGQKIARIIGLQGGRDHLIAEMCLVAGFICYRNQTFNEAAIIGSRKGHGAAGGGGQPAGLQGGRDHLIAEMIVGWANDLTACLLQGGRDHLIAEIGKLRGLIKQFNHPSMRPRSSDRGND